MAYRNELAAAQNRSTALAREFGNVRQQLAAHEADANESRWGRLMDRGARVEMRERAASRRDEIKAKAEAKRTAVREKRSQLRADRFQRYGNKRRYLRSVTAWGRCAHWFFPVGLLIVPIALVALYIIFPATRVYFAAWVVPSVVIWALANLWGDLCAKREAKAGPKLPFAVHGHHESVAARFRDLKLTISFEGASPTGSQMQCLLKGLAADTRSNSVQTNIWRTNISSESNEIVLEPKTLVTEWMRGNRGYVLWYRRVVERALIELHGAYPVSEVNISRS
jgi:hypothetical protein